MSREYEDTERAMLAVQRRQEGNTFCADCGGGSAEYVNLTVGTFICKDCADVHRSISHRRVKDIYGRDLTPEDVRRMADVGNDKANRRFLATWDPIEFPEPDRVDKERLQNFIWLKYEGSWKKAPAPVPQRYETQHASPRYGRERELFQDVPHQRVQQQEQPPRSVWAERLGRTRAPQPQPPAMPTLPARHEDYRRYDGGVERFSREPAMNRDRFRAPAQTGYGRRLEGGLPPHQQVRYREEYDEEYDRRSDRRRDSGRSERRDSGRSDYRSSGRNESQRRKDDSGRRKKSNRYASEEEDEDFGDGVVDKRRQRKTAKSRREQVQDSEDDSTDEDYASRSKKLEKKKKKKSRGKTTKKKRRDDSESESEVDDGDEEDDVESLPSTNPGSVHKGKAPANRPAKAEFDLMSDWMGADTETNTTAQSSTSAVTQQTPQISQMTPQPAVQMPMVAGPPMSMYGGMMPNPHAAYMTGMPYYMTGVPMGMGMGGMQMIPPHPQQHPQMGLPGVMNGMAAMSLGGPQQQPHALPQQTPPVPPPPPQMQQNGPVPPPPPGPPPS